LPVSNKKENKRLCSLIQISIAQYQTFSNNSTEWCNKLKSLVETQRNWQTSYWNVSSRDHYSGHPSQRRWAGNKLWLRLQQYIRTLVTTQLKPIPNVETQILSGMKMVLQYTIWHRYKMLQTMPRDGLRIWYHHLVLGFPTNLLVVKLTESRHVKSVGLLRYQSFKTLR